VFFLKFKTKFTIFQVVGSARGPKLTNPFVSLYKSSTETKPNVIHYA